MPIVPDLTAVQNPQALLANEDAFRQSQQGALSSSLDSMGASFFSATAGIEDLDHMMRDVPGQPAIQGLVDHLTGEQQFIPDSVGKSVGDFVGSVAGMALNPVSFVGGEAGAGIADYASSDLISNIPSAAAQKYAAFGIGGAAAMVGATTPSTIADSYNPDTNSVNVPQFFKETAINAGWGLATGATIAAAAHVGGMIKDAKVNAANTQEFQSAVDSGEFSQNAFDFYQATKDPAVRSSPEYQAQAQSVLKETGVTNIDAMGDVNVPILSETDMQNIASVMPYEMATGSSPRFSEYIVKNALDKATSNSSLMDMLEKLSASHNDLLDAKTQELNVQIGKAKDVLDATIQKINDNLKNNIEPIMSAEKAQSLFDKVANDDVRPGDKTDMEITELANKDNLLGGRLRDALNARRTIEQQKGYATIAKALTDYANLKKTSPAEDMTALVNHARGVLETKVINKINKQYEAAKTKVDTEISLMSDEDMQKFAEDASKEDSELGEDVKNSLDMYQKIKNAGKLLNDYIKCIGGVGG